MIAAINDMPYSLLISGLDLSLLLKGVYASGTASSWKMDNVENYCTRIRNMERSTLLLDSDVVFTLFELEEFQKSAVNSKGKSSRNSIEGVHLPSFGGHEDDAAGLGEFCWTLIICSCSHSLFK